MIDTAPIIESHKVRTGEEMDARELEGSLVLEKLAAAGAVDEFMEAVDADDLRAAKLLMKRAGVGAETIAIVLEKIASGDGEH